MNVGNLRDNILHIDAGVAVFINAFPVFNKQYLGRFMADVVIFCYFIGDGTVAKEVEEVE